MGLGACKIDNCFEQLSSVEPPEVGTDDLSFASPVELEAEEDIQVALEEGEGTCCLCGSSFEDSGLDGVTRALQVQTVLQTIIKKTPQAAWP